MYQVSYVSSVIGIVSRIRAVSNTFGYVSCLMNRDHEGIVSTNLVLYTDFTRDVNCFCGVPRTRHVDTCVVLVAKVTLGSQIVSADFTVLELVELAL